MERPYVSYAMYLSGKMVLPKPTEELKMLSQSQIRHGAAGSGVCLTSDSVFLWFDFFCYASISPLGIILIPLYIRSRNLVF